MNEQEYEEALREIEGVMDCPDEGPEADRLDELVPLVVAYEDEHYPIPPPSFIDRIRFSWDQRGPPIWDRRMWQWAGMSGAGAAAGIVGISYATSYYNLDWSWGVLGGIILAALWVVAERLFLGPFEDEEDAS